MNLNDIKLRNSDTVPKLFRHIAWEFSVVTQQTRHVCAMAHEIDVIETVLQRFPLVCSICVHRDMYSLIRNADFALGRISTRFPAHMITHLDIENCAVEVDDLIAFCAAFPLQYLSASCCRFDSNSSLRRLCDYLASGAQTTLMSLAIDRNNMESLDDWLSVCRMIRENRVLKHLSMIKNVADKSLNFVLTAIVDAVSESLAVNTTLQHLEMNECFSPVKQNTIMCSLLRSNMTITTLGLCDSLDQRRFVDRNSIFAEKGQIRVMLDQILPLLPFQLPFYVTLHIFDWLLFIRQPHLLCLTQTYCSCLPMETVENYRCVQKCALLRKLFDLCNRIRNDAIESEENSE